MRILCALAVTLPLAAQTPPAAPAPAENAASPVPSAESFITGYVELGYQWLTGVGGSFETYRSVVDLGSGPKLIGTDFTILDPKHRLFDRLRVRAYSWGGEPYSTLHVFAEKRNIYTFEADYRSLAYFNDLPSYADPLLGPGVALDEQSFDTRQHPASYSLDLFPNRTFSTYLGYDRDSNGGTGVTVFQTNGDEFAVPDTSRDLTNLYRGGVHIKGPRFHITLEEGGTTFRSDQNTYTATRLALDPGNNPVPYLGQTLDLSGLLQTYGIRGTGAYSKGIVTASPLSWLDIYGTFVFSQPTTNVNYQQYNNGSFVLPAELLFYDSEQYLVSAESKLPHVTANLGWEIRPASRLRLLQSVSTDRLHNAGSAAQNDTLMAGTNPATASSTVISDELLAALASSNRQTETTVLYDASKSVTLRGGYRYTWANAQDSVLPYGLAAIDHETLHRNTGLGGVVWRPSEKLSFTGEAELGSSGGIYFRTSFYDYKKARIMARYQLLSTLRLSADYNILSNRNPNVDASYKYLVHQESATLAWNPKAGDRFNLDATYEHCVYNSRIGYLVPETLASAESIYRENCHSISGFFNTGYRGAKLVAGGAAVLTSGSRPTTYYQPVVKFSVPVNKHLGYFAEWRYYGFGEAFYMYEAFRAHLFITGLRISR